MKKLLDIDVHLQMYSAANSDLSKEEKKIELV